MELYPIYELSSLLSLNDSNIIDSACIKNDEWIVLVLLTGFGHLIVYSNEIISCPKVSIVSWFLDSEKKPLKVAISSNGEQMLILTKNFNLFTASIKNNVQTTIDKSSVECDAVLFLSEFHTGYPNCLLWQDGFDNKSIILIGTIEGEIILIDFCEKQKFDTVFLNDAIINFSIIENKEIFFVLVQCRHGTMWKLIYNNKILINKSVLTFLEETEKILQIVKEGVEHGNESMNEILININSDVLSHNDELPVMTVYYPSFGILFSYNYLVMESCLDIVLKSVHSVPILKSTILFSSSLIFAFDRNKSELIILSKSLSKINVSAFKKEFFKNNDVIQKIQLPCQEKLIEHYFFFSYDKLSPKMENIIYKSQPFPSLVCVHQRILGKTNSQHLFKKQKIDECILVTTHSVYKCAPSVSINQLYLLLCGSPKTFTIAVKMAEAFNLMNKSLMEFAADNMLGFNNISQAFRLYHEAGLIENRLIKEALKYCKIMLSSPSLNLSEKKREYCVTLYLLCLLHIIFSGNEVEKIFAKKEFLSIIFTKMNFNIVKITQILVRYYCWEFTEVFLNSFGVCFEVLASLLCINDHVKQINPKIWKFHEDKYVKCLCNHNLQYAFIHHSIFAIEHFKLLQTFPTPVKSKYLSCLLCLYDPSKTEFRVALKEVQLQNSTEQLDIHIIKKILSCGYSHSALISNYSLFLWGKGINGIQGNGYSVKTDSTLSKVFLFSFLKIPVFSVACGKDHTLALTTYGVFSWGSSFYGQLGLGNKKRECFPRLLQNSFGDELVINISCGQYHSVAVTASGKIFTWGWGIHGQLGHGNIENMIEPKIIQALVDKIIIDAGGGYCHTSVLSVTGCVYVMGSNRCGQLGMKTFKENMPKCLQFPNKIKQISVGYVHNLAVDCDGLLYQWGSVQKRKRKYVHSFEIDPSKQVENNDKFNDGIIPKLINIQNVKYNIVQISCGAYHNIILTENGLLYSWGSNLDCQLGHKGRKTVHIPQLVNNISGIKFVACGSDFSIALHENGTVLGWGHNDLGQLSCNPESDKSETLLRLSSSKHILRIRKTFGASISKPIKICQVQNLDPIYLPDLNISDKYINALSILPTLDQLDIPSYGPKCLHASLELFLGLYSSIVIKNLFLEKNDFQSLSKLFALEEDWETALYFSFQAIKETSEKILDDIEFVWDKFLLFIPVHMDLQGILQKLAEFVISENISISFLEFLWSKQVSRLVPYLNKLLYHKGISDCMKQRLLSGLSLSFLEQIKEIVPELN